MGKRSNFDRIERDFYPTPKEAVMPLIPFLKETTYIEPCAGDGSLISHIPLRCLGSCDLEPQNANIYKYDCFKIEYLAADLVITNPPWDRNFLHQFIEKFRKMSPTWLLFDADWMHTKQSKDYIKFCSKIVSVGRVKWIPNSTMTGKDNCAWYRFEANRVETIFYGR